MTLDEVAGAKEETPVTSVPFGSLKWHSWHLPAGFDGIKAYELCLRIAKRTGGVVLPPVYFGTGGRHYDYSTSLMVEDDRFGEIVRYVFERLTDIDFEVIVGLTGHYPGEQIDVIDETAETVEDERDVTVLVFPEHEAYPDEERHDHTGKWERSIMQVLQPNSSTWGR